MGQFRVRKGSRGRFSVQRLIGYTDGKPSWGRTSLQTFSTRAAVAEEIERLKRQPLASELSADPSERSGLTPMIVASRIQDALRYRHAKDLYIAECKNGPTQSIGARPIRLDGWAFVKTWSPVTAIGYEIKVSRSDFIGDHKWRDYLPLCHQLYFVAPKGLIQLEELPSEVGLIEAIGGQNGNMLRLVTRRKAVYREPETTAYLSLLHYVLMCRVRPGGTWVEAQGVEIDEAARRQERINEWVEWLRNRTDAESMGRRISAAVRDELDALRSKTSAADAKVRSYESTRRVLRSLGFDPDKPLSEWRIQKQIERALGVVTPDLVESVERAKSGLAGALAEFERIRAMAELPDPEVGETRG